MFLRFLILVTAFKSVETSTEASGVNLCGLSKVSLESGANAYYLTVFKMELDDQGCDFLLKFKNGDQTLVNIQRTGP